MTNTDEYFSVYVVEDNAAVLASLCALLAAHGIDTIPCPSAEHFIQIYDPAKRACMILDVRLPGMSGIQLQSYLNDNGIAIPIIVITAHGNVSIAVKAMQAGAIDFIEKPASKAQLLEALTTASGMLFNRQATVVSKKVVASRLEKLTDREREILDHLLTGKLNKEIASALDVSQRTVEGHRSRIREKMHARGIADLVRMLG
ncbi:response regulator transcription factor [Thalassobium sp. R2A62]|jgi:FixJ family two-component response regulator|uniref:response regulator transcription factor n=1 Tax=Thalassobium sp. R2A62 TaxID=633131 RepID=UPI0001B1CE8D|nr:response regulator [Thalassobium sp. R2A62]EET47858.1 transcriptional regulatory protein FixJ [Thalassobium sp. R2A62]